VRKLCNCNCTLYAHAHALRFAYGHVDAMRFWANRGSAILACDVNRARRINTEAILNEHLLAHGIKIVKTDMTFARVRSNGLLAPNDRYMVEEACQHGDAPACKFLAKVPQRKKAAPKKNAAQEANRSTAAATAATTAAGTTAVKPAARSAAAKAKAAAAAAKAAAAKKKGKDAALLQAQLATDMLQQQQPGAV
jgi:hypothetical protein